MRRHEPRAGLPTDDGWDWQGTITTAVGATRDEVRVADINGDGRDDYYWLSEGGAVRVWLCNGIVRKVASS
ncbi:hypothetical protein ACWGN5_36625 [Streptomyces sp. NPDC055815]